MRVVPLYWTPRNETQSEVTQSRGDSNYIYGYENWVPTGKDIKQDPRFRDEVSEI